MTASEVEENTHAIDDVGLRALLQFMEGSTCVGTATCGTSGDDLNTIVVRIGHVGRAWFCWEVGVAEAEGLEEEEVDLMAILCDGGPFATEALAQAFAEKCLRWLRWHEDDFGGDAVPLVQES